jgi:hypothetical protein
MLRGACLRDLTRKATIHFNDQAVEDLLDFPYDVTDIGEFVARQGEISERGFAG